MLRSVLGFALVASLSLPALAATRTVGNGKEFAAPCAAIAAADAGDVIEIDAGTYARDMCAINKRGLTLRGVGGRPIVDAQGGGFGGKGIWVVSADDVTIENLELRNAAVPDKNGAGIRQEGANLTVRDVVFRDNQNGILAGDNPNSTITIEGCEFVGNGAGDGQSHNLYINHVQKLVFRGNWTHQAKVGHLLKSRAAESLIEANRITGEEGTSSYELEFPNGGFTIVRGNVIEQGPNTENPAILSYGAEGAHARNPSHDLIVSHNTFVNHRNGSTTFVRVADAMLDGELHILNNIFSGSGTVSNATVTEIGSCTTPTFVDAVSFDFHQAAGSACLDNGSADLDERARPTLQYVHPTSTEGRVFVGAPDPGAFELGGGVPPGSSSSGGSSSGGTAPGGSSSGATGSSGALGASGSSGASGDAAADDDTEGDDGCGCHTSSSPVSGLMLFFGALLLLRRRPS